MSDHSQPLESSNACEAARLSEPVVGCDAPSGELAVSQAPAVSQTAATSEMPAVSPATGLPLPTPVAFEQLWETREQLRHAGRRISAARRALQNLPDCLTREIEQTEVSEQTQASESKLAAAVSAPGAAPAPAVPVAAAVPVAPVAQPIVRIDPAPEIRASESGVPESGASTAAAQSPPSEASYPDETLSQRAAESSRFEQALPRANHSAGDQPPGRERRVRRMRRRVELPADNEMPAAAEPRRSALWSLVALSLGIAATTCGGLLVGLSFMQARHGLWNLGLPIVLAGQLALVAGLLLHLDAQRDQDRPAAPSPSQSSQRNKSRSRRIDRAGR